MSKVYGNTALWGFSPAQDLLDVLNRHVKSDVNNALNILLVGSGDGRHILKTLTKLHKSKREINFYVIENDLETVARQILLINLANESLNKYGVLEKAELFLDLFGNSLIRDVTEDYLCKKADEFIKWITDNNRVESGCLSWDFSNLKFKERDQLEGIFKFWRNKDESIFNIKECWDQRLRHHLGVRYDSRENCYDWEYSMKLKGKASILGWHEYKQWREFGVAFNVRDESAYVKANKTLASGVVVKKDGERINRRGYWGDIMNSPFISFGVESDDKSLFKTNNNIHVKTSTDVCLHNITSIIHELNYGVPCSQKTEDKVTEVVSEKEDSEDCPAVSSDKLTNSRVFFLPAASVSDLHRKSKYKSKFDLISFSNSMVHFLDDAVKILFSPNGLLMIESTKFMLDLKDDLHQEYEKKIKSMAEAVGCVEVKNFDVAKDSFAVFKFAGC